MEEGKSSETEDSMSDDETTDEESGEEGESTYYSLGSNEDVHASWWFSSRLALALFAFFGCMSMASQRVCMRVAMPCMVNSTTDLDQDFVPSGYDNVTWPPATTTPSVEEECGKRPRIFPENLTLHATWEGTFDWTETKKDVVSGMFFWGYLMSQIPSGWLATKFGGKYVIGGMMLMGSVCTGLVPLAARAHYYTLIATRFLGGVGVGVIFPAMHAFWGRWAPPEERSRLASIGFAGGMLGHVVTFPLSAVLCEYGIDGGWPSIFYLLGGLGVIWSILWILFANSTPMVHGRISSVEKEYIMETLSGEALLNGEKYDNTPWITFFGSVPFMVIVVNHFTYDWGMYNLEVSVPVFMKSHLKYDLDMDPAIHAFPYIGLGFLIFMTGIWSDKLRLRGVIKTSIVRKIFQSIGTFIPVSLMVLLGFLGCHQAAGAVSILVLCMTFVAFQYNGFVMNHLDIAPKYAGILFGISNTVGTLAIALAPLLRNLIIEDNTREQWQTWFLISASLEVFGTICFIIGAAGEVQEWAECDELNHEGSSSDASSPPASPPGKVTLRSKSIHMSPQIKKNDSSESGTKSAAKPPLHHQSSKQAPQRLSVPDLPSELHRQPSQKTHGSKKSSAPDISGRPPQAIGGGHRGSQKRGDASDESMSSSRSSNIRRSGDSPSTIPPNLDALSESIV